MNYSINTGNPPSISNTPHNDDFQRKVKPRRASTAWRITKYFLLRTVAIFLTIFIGVFITVLIANRAGLGGFCYNKGDNVIECTRGGAIDSRIDQQAYALATQEVPSYVHWWEMPPEEYQKYFSGLYSKYREKLGLTLPFLPRHLLWTWQALRFDRAFSMLLFAFPGTLLIVGPAFLLVFLLGMPLSLYLFRHHGSRLDRLFTFLAPISSIPSWVLGMLLVLIFAVGLHLLPPSRMLDATNPRLSLYTLPDLLKHMILPVLAIFLSLFFQLLYTWKTFFLIYASEDYVELGRAKGLPDRELEKKYILRPSLNYILTNIALMLVTFWQLTIALEYIFDWSGIGSLYINALPNIRGETPFPGDMNTLVGIVVFFAYLLGFTMLLLDVVYALVDPRIRLGSEGQTVQGKIAKGRRVLLKSRRRDGQYSPQKPKEEKSLSTETASSEQLKPLISKTNQDVAPAADSRSRSIPGMKWRRSTPEASRSIPGAKRMGERKGLAGGDSPSDLDQLKAFPPNTNFLKPFFQELRRYPTAIFGLVIILLMVIGSIIAVTAFPYYRLGGLWYETELTGKAYIPRIAKPAWINYFLKDPLPPSFYIDSSKGQAQKTISPDKAGAVEHTVLTYPIKYPYGGFPTDLTMYFTTRYTTRRPFISLTWLTPDGRNLVLDNLSPTGDLAYSLARDLSARKLVQGFPSWGKWFSFETWSATPAYYLMFADPAAQDARVLPGNYTLQVDIFTYEPESSADAELVLLGQTYGLAGTDYLRRDLVVPLLWGMPFALALGLVGASLTTFLSMVLAAAGVFFGGWLDQLIQRLIEGIMILPIIAIGVILYINFNLNIWVFLALIALLNVFGSPTKSFRAALLQIKDSPYIEWARASGAGNLHIILNYFLPNILPLLVPQLVALIPTYVFLEATLGIFGIKSAYPTWGRVIYDALQHGAVFGSSYWVFEPISLLLLTGLAFSMLGFALEKILNPRLKNI